MVLPPMLRNGYIHGHYKAQTGRLDGILMFVREVFTCLGMNADGTHDIQLVTLMLALGMSEERK